ncbi:hypothetical protein MAR_020998 [Mya arenaria]|uniref:Uncharacterized protein n=1 Tax=Mya arenaria TaxID=6604 RepID=A0ABY7EB35_MYAAR|nr:hypothetical protein MAR_020998 [Mya arenaria]
MENDEVTIYMRNDLIIVKIWGNLKLSKLARFLIAAKKDDPELQCLDDVIDPTKFKCSVDTVKMKTIFEIPCLLSKLDSS